MKITGGMISSSGPSTGLRVSPTASHVPFLGLVSSLEDEEVALDDLEIPF